MRISGQRLYRPCSDVQCKNTGYPLHSLYFPFTSPPVCHCVPSGSERAIIADISLGSRCVCVRRPLLWAGRGLEERNDCLRENKEVSWIVKDWRERTENYPPHYREICRFASVKTCPLKLTWAWSVHHSSDPLYACQSFGSESNASDGRLSVSLNKYCRNSAILKCLVHLPNFHLL